MTSEERHALHKKLWGWAYRTGKSNLDWPGWEGKNGEFLVAHNRCFACEEAICRRKMLVTDPDSVTFCLFCPMGTCEPFWFDWDDAICAGNTKGAKSLARQIRDLPWSPRPGVEA